MAWKAKPACDPAGFNVTQVGKGLASVTAVIAADLTLKPTQKLDILKDSQTQIYNQVKAALVAVSGS